MKFCKKCGNQLEDEALFCSKCGANTAGNEEQDEKEPTTKGCGCYIALLAVFFAVIFIFVLVKYSGEKNGHASSNSNGGAGVIQELISRDANNNDIEIMDALNMSALGVDLVITPNTDIKDLKIKITHYDKTGKILQTQTVTLGNVKEGVQIKKTISIVDLGLIDLFRIKTTLVEVVGGTVSYLR